jgi:hypothetical protein
LKIGIDLGITAVFAWKNQQDSLWSEQVAAVDKADGKTLFIAGQRLQDALGRSAVLIFSTLSSTSP